MKILILGIWACCIASACCWGGWDPGHHPQFSIAAGYTKSIGSCRGGKTPENKAGETKHRYKGARNDCLDICNGDSSCTGYTIDEAEEHWCWTHTSHGAHGDGITHEGYGVRWNDANVYRCWMKEPPLCKCDDRGRYAGNAHTDGVDWCYLEVVPCKLPAVPNPNSRLVASTVRIDPKYPEWANCSQNGVAQIHCDDPYTTYGQAKPCISGMEISNEGECRDAVRYALSMNITLGERKSLRGILEKTLITGSWDHIPSGCSYDASGNGTLYFNQKEVTNAAGFMDGTYKMICKREKYDKAQTSLWCKHKKDIEGRNCESDKYCLENARGQCDKDPNCFGVLWHQKRKEQKLKICLSKEMVPKMANDGWRTMMKTPADLCCNGYLDISGHKWGDYFSSFSYDQTVLNGAQIYVNTKKGKRNYIFYDQKHNMWMVGPDYTKSSPYMFHPTCKEACPQDCDNGWINWTWDAKRRRWGWQKNSAIALSCE